ncbi:MAG: universal stress protein [Rhodoferax sp.]|nr:universal stress protein [Rhodoferax sp.]
MAEVFTRLLLATEHSPFDVGAEAVALAMAQRCGLPLDAVLPLLSNPEFEALAPQIAARADREAAAKIAELRAQAASAGVTVAIEVRRGEELYEEIVQQALAQKSELIIIRRRGKRSFLAQLMVGEMVTKVVAHAPCHVLIVPREARMWSHRVLVAAEPSAQGQKIVTTAIAVAAQCNLPLHLVSVVAAEALREPALNFAKAMQKQAERASVLLEADVPVGKPFEEILACQRRTKSDLILIGSKDDSDIHRALVGGVAQKVLGLSEHPVLVLHV